MADDDVYSEFDRHEGDRDWFEEGEETYEEMLDGLIEDFGSETIDSHAADLLYDGWFNPDTDAVERAEIWFEFFDYTGIEYEDFDWEGWREWYES